MRGKRYQGEIFNLFNFMSKTMTWQEKEKRPKDKKIKQKTYSKAT